MHHLVSNTSTHPYTDGKLLDMVTASSLGHKTCAVILVGRPNLGTSVRRPDIRPSGNFSTIWPMSPYDYK